MKGKKRWLSILCLALTAVGCGAFGGCNGFDLHINGVFNPSSSEGLTQEDNEIRQVYATYVAYAEEKGENPLSYEMWLISIRGQDGANGQDGVDGLTPFIGENGNWWIGTLDTGVRASGEKGDKGDQGETGAQGPQGEKGDKGDQGETGAQGPQGEQGEKGEDGVGIEKVEYDKDGNLVITFTDGTTQTVVMPEKEEHVHTFGEWIELTGANTPSEGKLFFSVCATCGSIEWKQGICKEHVWNIVTTEPTCQAQGYDTKTCEICGKVEIDNYTAITNHIWGAEYSCDNSYHWIDCNTCTDIKEKNEHTPDETGVCSVCQVLVGATEGILYDFSADGSYAEVIGYEGNATRVRIADTYNGVPVKTICDRAFFDNDNIIEMVIPDSVTTIGSYAFEDCGNLKNIVIPDSVTVIDEYAFSHCGLMSVLIPKGVTEINMSVFFGCGGLTSVVIPDSVASIGVRAFANCGSLTSVVIPDSVIEIQAQAFSNCSQLNFNEYSNGQYLGTANNPYYALIQASNKNYSNYIIHQDTKILAGDVFRDCTRMINVIIPDSVTMISSSAFYNCSSLISVVIPNSVTTIGWHAFYNCSSLTSVVIPDSVITIGGYAFDDCSSLTTVYYKGTASDWKEMEVGKYNTNLTDATIYYYSETSKSGCWYFNENGEPTLW